MKLQFLGTAAAEGIPGIFCRCPQCRYALETGGKEIRTRCSAMVDDILKLDNGPDSYLQMLRFGLDYTRLTAIFFTHSHPDHLNPGELKLRKVPGFAVLPLDTPPLEIYGNDAVGSLINDYLGKAVTFRKLQAFDTVQTHGYTVTALQAVHCLSGSSRQFPVEFEGTTYFRTEDALFYLIEKDGKKLLYAHDTDEFSPAVMDVLRDTHLDLISLDCTNASLHFDYIGHMGAEDVLRQKQALLDIGAADEHTIFVANHFSHNGCIPHEELEQLLSGFVVAYDGLTIEF